MARQGELFSMAPVLLPDDQPRKRWGGRASIKARAYCRTLLPAACWRGCGRIISTDTPDSQWHAGHVQGRAEGGRDNPENFLPECAKCNTSEGGKVGAAITNGRKVTVQDVIRERTRKWY